MPIEYEGALAEHRAVRERVGLFDLTHLGKVEVEGPGALALLQGVVTNDVAAIEVGEAQYNLVLNEGGGVIEDLIVYRMGDQRYFVVPNASNTHRVLQILGEAETPDTVHLMYHQDWCFLAVQGPESPPVVERVPGGRGLAFMRCTESSFQRRPVIVTRSGYTGEVGFELFTYQDIAVELWRVLLGGGARRRRRVRAGSPHAMCCGSRWATRCTVRICSSPRPRSRRACRGRCRWTRARSAAARRSPGSGPRGCRAGSAACGCTSAGTSRGPSTRCSSAIG